MRPATRLVQFNACPGEPFGATCTPVYQTATFDQDSPLEFGRYDYTRSGNPTREVLERQIADLEGGVRCFAFASGLAAITAVLNLLGPGDEVLACDDLYGGTYRLLSRILARRGIVVNYADLTDTQAAAAAFTPRTKLVFLESVSNPLMRICDIKAIAELAHRHNAHLCVDNTALTPLSCRPLELGADFVVHSATKYLCGHSDVTAGVVTVRDKALADELYMIQNGEGAGLGPQDSYLLLRGLKTLDLRLERQQRSAAKVAEFLETCPGVTQVLFPGLEKHNVAHLRQSTGHGAVVCFRTGSPQVSAAILESLTLFGIRVSFGGVSSSASLPCRMSHASIPAPVREARHFPEDLIRLSIGIEDVRDLIEDLRRAVASVATVVCCEPAVCSQGVA
ncbi:MAG: aminotransferase class V-fold PLP-dependent enzyme [Planctomycetes bacterium]|nr:aminotransferase class V-fold PLP-dependent enzyme [Planctomycetota bacterium]